MIILDHQVKHDWPSLAVEGESVFVVTLPEHGGSFNTREVFHCLIPCNEFSLNIDHHRGVRKKFYDLSQPTFALFRPPRTFSAEDVLLSHQIEENNCSPERVNIRKRAT